MATLTMSQDGSIHLPDSIRDRYGFTPDTRLRIIETSGGILIVPFTDAQMDPELALELEEWQALGQQSWNSDIDAELPEHSENELSALIENLIRNLADRFPLKGPIPGLPSQITERLEKLITILAVDFDLLERCEYYNMNQACTKLCDLFEKNEAPRIKSFTHCGESFSFHVFQFRVRCPICRTEIKMAGLFGEDDPIGVAASAWTWLGMRIQSVPGWNPDVQNSSYDSKPARPDPSLPG